MDLHILNGDFALEHWKKCDFQEESLVWRETYLEGPLPDTEDLHTFRIARAEYLSTFRELSGIDAERLYQHLKKMDDAILNLPEKSSVMLWFDACMYDQTLLMRILWLFCRKKNDGCNIFLYCCDSDCLTENDFQSGVSKKILLHPEDLNIAAKAWNFFQRKDADGMKQLIETGNFDRMPQIKKSLYRCIEEIPDRTGFTRTERQIIQLISEGKHTFPEIFKGLDRFEEFPFLGDTACQRILDRLVIRKVLVCKQEQYDLIGSVLNKG